MKKPTSRSSWRRGLNVSCQTILINAHACWQSIRTSVANIITWFQNSWLKLPGKACIFQALFQPLRLFILLRRSWPLSYLYPQFKVRFSSYMYISVHFISTIGYITNSKRPALRLAWLVQWKERCNRSSQTVRVQFPVTLVFFRSFFNR